MKNVLTFIALVVSQLFMVYGAVKLIQWSEQFSKWISVPLGIAIGAVVLWRCYQDVVHFNK